MTTVAAIDDVGRILARELVAALPAGGPECVVGACGREDCDAFAEIAAGCESASVPFFVVVLGPGTLRVSAVYGRDYGSCYHCRAEAARAARGPFEHPAPVPAGHLPQHLRFATLAVADAIWRLPSGDPLLRTHRILDLFENTLSSVPSEDVHA